MRTYKEIEQEYQPHEIAESLVFPDSKNADEKNNTLAQFRKFRKETASVESDELKYKSRLLQLKFIMEDQVSSTKFDEKYDFAYFLSQYITCQELKFKEFANDIDIIPSTLSQIIRRNRKPTDKIIYRLHLHSNQSFPASLWYKLLEKQKIFELENDKSILETESKHVKHKLAFSL